MTSQTVIYSVVFTVIFLLFYKFVLNPTIIRFADLSKMSICPDSWSYDGSQCIPNMSTSCSPFTPNTKMLETLSARCRLAKMCGTTWSGVC
jgi:hypothetical protein